jgi:hypothetical protein
MYYDDHPPPHFHAYYEDFEVQISIKTLEVLNGSFPPSLGHGYRMGFSIPERIASKLGFGRKTFSFE